MSRSVLFILGIVFLFLGQSCLSQDKTKQNAVEIAKELKAQYSKAKSENNFESKEYFFEVFPSTFSLFKKIYGYTDKKEFKPHELYSVYHSHLKFFCGLKNIIAKKSYYKKLIGLGINGKWQADAVNSLQHCLKESVQENLPLTISVLENYSNEDIKSFWYFLFDGPHPSETIPIKIEKVRNINSEIANLAEEAFQEILKDAEPHGR